MGINPVAHIQTQLHSTPDVARQQSIDTNKAGNILTQAAEDEQKKVQKDIESVKNTEKSEKTKVTDKKEKNQSNGQKKKKQQNQNVENSSTIDIRI